MDSPLIKFTNCNLAGGLQTNGACTSAVVMTVCDAGALTIVNTNYESVACNYDTVGITHNTSAPMSVTIANPQAAGMLTINAQSSDVLTVLSGDHVWSAVNVNAVTNPGGLVLILDDVATINWGVGAEANTTIMYTKAASQVGYSPAVPGDWSPAPTQVAEALDQLAVASGITVDGPASATDDAVARFDGTTGKLIQNSAVTVSDAGNIDTAGVVQANTLAPHSAGALTVQAPREASISYPLREAP